MRRFRYFILSLGLGASGCTAPLPAGSGKIEFTNPVAYNEYIIEQQTKIISHILAVHEAMERNPSAVQALLQKGSMTTDSSLAALETLQGFGGDTLLRNRAISNIYFYKKLFTKAFPRILSIYSNGDSLTEEDFHTLENLQHSISKEESRLDQQLVAAQADFARRNKIPLLENAAQKRIDAAR